jgi:hypothetical protein
MPDPALLTIPIELKPSRRAVGLRAKQGPAGSCRHVAMSAVPVRRGEGASRGAVFPAVDAAAVEPLTGTASVGWSRRSRDT